MPIGFICLGVIAIYQAFFETGKQEKYFSVLLCLFAMLGFFTGNIIIGDVIVNIVFLLFSIIMIVLILKNSTKNEIFNMFFQSLFVTFLYVLIAKFNSDYLISLNPYPFCFVLLTFNLINIKKFSMVLGIDLLTFLFVSFVNLFLERMFEFVCFAGFEFFNLLMVMLMLMKVCNLVYKCFFTKYSVIKDTK